MLYLFPNEDNVSQVGGVDNNSYCSVPLSVLSSLSGISLLNGGLI